MSASAVATCGLQLAKGAPVLCLLLTYRYLPPATKLVQGNVFTGICDSVKGGMLFQDALQVVSQHALQQVSWGGAWSWGGSAPRGVPALGGVPAPRRDVAFCYGLLLWSSVMPFCYGLLVWWPSD